jgi:hypothetical protein
VKTLRRSLLAFVFGTAGAGTLQLLDYAEALDRTVILSPAPADLNLGDCLRGRARSDWPAPYLAICRELTPRPDGPRRSSNAPIRAAVEPARIAAEPVCTVEETGATTLVHAEGRKTLPPKFAGQRSPSGKSAGVALLVHGSCSVESPVAGRVLFAGEFKGYRGVVILGLGADRRLVVAGLGALGVKRGEKIKRGMGIGTTSETRAPALASAFGLAADTSLLYFDMRNARGADNDIFNPAGSS